MKPLCLLLLAACAARPADKLPLGIRPGERIPQFTAQAVVHEGGKAETVTIDSHKTPRPVVYVFVGTRCPATKEYLGRMRDLEAAYRARGVDFVFIYPNKTDSAEEKAAHHRDEKLGGPMIDDVGAKIAKATLGAQRTSEILIAAADGEILYRGAIDDNRDAAKVTRRHVAAALDEHLAKKPVTVRTTDVHA